MFDQPDFVRPYHSWERGSNENLNGLIRQYIPKKTDFSKISDDFIEQIEDKINRRTRKRFDYESPQEKLQNLLAQNLHLLLESAVQKTKPFLFEYN